MPLVVEAVVDEIKVIHKTRGLQAQHLGDNLRACVQLKDDAPCVLEAVPAIASQIILKAGDMTPQQLSTSLLATAKLKDVAPAVLEAVPAIAGKVREKAKGMPPQQLSACIWASSQLKDVAPAVLEMVPTLVAEFPRMDEAKLHPQRLSDTLKALDLLQNGFLSFAAAQLNTLLPKMRTKRLNSQVPSVVWSCAKAGVYPGELLASLALRLGPPEVAALTGFSLCALSWSYEVLDAQQNWKDFRKLLRSETKRRGFSEADVESCKLGRLQWNHAGVE